jgi:hypothetical protein
LEEACEYTLAFAVIAHELGHVLDPECCVDRWPSELRADRVAGMALALAGLSPEPVVRMWITFPWGETHPPPQMRIEALLGGYQEAACRMASVA